MIVAIAACSAFVVALVLTGVVRSTASRHGLIDVPNARSSHHVATPRGGGIAIVSGAFVASVILIARGELPIDLALAVWGGGLMVAGVGFMDDRYNLSARLRLGVHFAAAILAVLALYGMGMHAGGHVFAFQWLYYLACVLGIVWSLNLFNFMDGIDGIAAAEAAFVGAGALLLAWQSNDVGTGAAIAVCVAGAALGFLVWNWPPAKIFMGDVGSGFVGYALAVLAVAIARESPVALLEWLILGGVFFVDATVTLIRRLARGEKASVAHRSHAYQWLARRWGSHLRVTLVVCAIDVLWLLPLAWLCTQWPARAPSIVIAALAPLVVLALLAGAGRAESRSH